MFENTMRFLECHELAALEQVSKHLCIFTKMKGGKRTMKKISCERGTRGEGKRERGGEWERGRAEEGRGGNLNQTLIINSESDQDEVLLEVVMCSLFPDITNYNVSLTK